MNFDQEKVPRLFLVAIAKSNNCRRNISCFKTELGRQINVYFFSGQVGWNLEESYSLYPDGRCRLDLMASVRGSTGKAIHSFQSSRKWTSEQLHSDGPLDNPEWILGQLNTLADWLESKTTFRVHPYQHDQVLTGENEPIDQWLGNAQEVIEDHRREWKKLLVTLPQDLN